MQRKPRWNPAIVWICKRVLSATIALLVVIVGLFLLLGTC